MESNRVRSRVWATLLLLSLAGLGAACGSKQPPVTAPARVQPVTPAATTTAAPAATTAAVPLVRPLEATHQTWTAAAMEALLAPIALYPDPVLSQVLMAATNPQEVLDAGNWLIDHPQLVDKDLDLAAAVAGFTPPMRALMQFRQIVDQMCLKMGWTTELGQAFTNDQAGVLAAVQRLRRQAQEAGHLESSPQMAVATQEQDDQKVIVISPPNPRVVYVPQYDPTTAYLPAPEDSVYATETRVSTGVLAFGAGLIIGNVFDGDADDYYHHIYYYPDYAYGRYPACPPRHYRPGDGYRPGHYYKRPPRYEDRLRDDHVLVVDHGSDEYWNHFDERPVNQGRAESVPSPIAVARLNRSQPGLGSAADRAPPVREETIGETVARTPGYSGRAPELGVTGTRRDDNDRGQPHHEANPGPRLVYDSPAPPDSSVVHARHIHSGEREPTRDDGQSQIPRQTAPGLVVAPPPASAGDGRHDHAGSKHRNAGGEPAAGANPHDSPAPAPGRNAVVGVQPQER